jgi:hypothetical protein
MRVIPGKPLCGQPAKRPGLSGYPIKNIFPAVQKVLEKYMLLKNK